MNHHDADLPAAPSGSTSFRRAVGMHVKTDSYTDVVCDDGSLWRWSPRRGWRLVAVVPGSAAHRVVERAGTLDGYPVQPNED